MTRAVAFVEHANQVAEMFRGWSPTPPAHQITDTMTDHDHDEDDDQGGIAAATARR
jgi:hypothetical protein